jgi:hypothetical protein
VGHFFKKCFVVLPNKFVLELPSTTKYKRGFALRADIHQILLSPCSLLATFFIKLTINFSPGPLLIINFELNVCKIWLNVGWG